MWQQPQLTDFSDQVLLFPTYGGYWRDGSGARSAAAAARPALCAVHRRIAGRRHPVGQRRAVQWYDGTMFPSKLCPLLALAAIQPVAPGTFLDKESFKDFIVPQNMGNNI